MSTEVLIQDTLQVLEYVRGKFPDQSIILLGHAMGGAIATKTLNLIESEMAGSDLQKSIKGLIVIELTEESANDALPHMEEVIGNRPTGFPDLKEAIRYAVMGRMIRDRRSASVSMPAQLSLITDPETGKDKHVWRTDLRATMPFWEQWFANFNECFLSVKENKWLFLVNSEAIEDSLYG